MVMNVPKRPTIARIWRGRTSRERGDEYEAHNYEADLHERGRTGHPLAPCCRSQPASSSSETRPSASANMSGPQSSTRSLTATHAGGHPRGSRPYTCRYARTVAGGGWSIASSRARAFDATRSARRRSISACCFCAFNHVVVIGEYIPQTRTHQFGELFVRPHRPRLIFAAHVLQSRLRECTVGRGGPGTALRSTPSR
jgi:hypothetical protein